jgi:hypothetical protein
MPTMVAIGQNGFQFGQNVFKSRPTWRAAKKRNERKSFQPLIGADEH